MEFTNVSSSYSREASAIFSADEYIFREQVGNRGSSVTLRSVMGASRMLSRHWERGVSPWPSFLTLRGPQGVWMLLD